ncbi:MAG: HlyD family type I secretion periplasmic adaptor subunit [Pseudomonadota bacterium]
MTTVVGEALIAPIGGEDDRAIAAQTKIRREIRVAIIFLSVFVLLFCGAGVFVPIGGAVIAAGTVAVESNVKRVAHPNGGIIEEILVRDGDQVEKGDPLIRLNTNVASASAELSSRSVAQLLAQKARLEALQEGRDSLTFAAELSQAQDAESRAAMQTEQRLFDLVRAEQTAIVAQLNERVRQYQEQISGISAQIVALKTQQELIEPELAGVRDLYERGYVTITRLNELERTSASLSGSLGALQSDAARARAGISETKEQILQIQQSTRAQAGADLASTNAALNDRRMASVSAADTFDRSVIVAPGDGIIDKLVFTTRGEVITPAETILEIVPLNDELLLEASIAPADIDQVSMGQSAMVRFSAFNLSETPQFDGHVTFISAEVAVDPNTGLSFYRARIQLDKAQSQTSAIAILPGMPAEIFIETGRRSVLSYVTKPLQDQLARAFKD